MQKMNYNHKQTILILEDDEDLAEGISMSLAGGDLEIVLCSTISQARERMRERVFDLLVLDINLPDGSGLEYCREIRESDRVPIALLTARDMELDIVKGLECGADDYITKPFSLMVLRARIRALLRRNPGNRKSEYSNGVFRFFFDTMEFYKEGRPVELSRTEQRILYLLVFNAGRILTRERLLEWVWPDGTEYVEDNALSVGIRRLRDKLEDVPSKPVYIKTVYGKGYLWESCYRLAAACLQEPAHPFVRRASCFSICAAAAGKKWRRRTSSCLPGSTGQWAGRYRKRRMMNRWMPQSRSA